MLGKYKPFRRRSSPATDLTQDQLSSSDSDSASDQYDEFDTSDDDDTSDGYGVDTRDHEYYFYHDDKVSISDDDSTTASNSTPPDLASAPPRGNSFQPPSPLYPEECVGSSIASRPIPQLSARFGSIHHRVVRPWNTPQFWVEASRRASSALGLAAAGCCSDTYAMRGVNQMYFWACTVLLSESFTNTFAGRLL